MRAEDKSWWERAQDKGLIAGLAVVDVLIDATEKTRDGLDWLHKAMWGRKRGNTNSS